MNIFIIRLCNLAFAHLIVLFNCDVRFHVEQNVNKSLYFHGNCVIKSFLSLFVAFCSVTLSIQQRPSLQAWIRLKIEQVIKSKKLPQSQKVQMRILYTILKKWFFHKWIVNTNGVETVQVALIFSLSSWNKTSLMSRKWSKIWRTKENGTVD